MWNHRCSIAVSIMVVFCCGLALAQNTNKSPDPAGGKTSDGAAPSKTKPKPAVTTTKATKARPVTANPKPAPRASAGMDSINGKWWTTGNDFDTSELLLEQHGNLISGAIMYADGRTGTFSGVLSGKRINFNWANSAGDRGTGWLEHSWNNFLGGSYRNQKGGTGSWTLSRIAGNWCLGGSRNRIRKVNHGSRGQLFFVTEDGGKEAGHLEGPFIFLHGDFGDVKGIMNFQSNRVDFATGTFWTWCGLK
ncbi:MAG TPA: hypothetical protein VN643_06795 [Pyrinomonadaceae bacterium]|nr:hypothetical protein [Pyrinomonadaceae bacterium]